MQLSQLIEQAAGRAGSKTALARAIGVTPQRLNDYRTGARPCPLHHQAQIAEAAGEDAKEWIWQAVRHQIASTARAAVLVLAVLAASLAPVAGGDGQPEGAR